MKIVKNVEEEASQRIDDNAKEGSSQHTLSSFNPCDPPLDFCYSKSADSRFLPCHYFDYVGGTSTGACVSLNPNPRTK